MAEVPVSRPTPAPHNQPTSPDQQVILQSTRDAELQPDALRGSEHLIKDMLANGDIVDLEANRRDKIENKK
jgi:hypothetical protein